MAEQTRHAGKRQSWQPSHSGRSSRVSTNSLMSSRTCSQERGGCQPDSSGGRGQPFMGGGTLQVAASV